MSNIHSSFTYLIFTFTFNYSLLLFIQLVPHNVHPPPFLLGGGGPNFQKGGLDRTLILKGGWWERGGDRNQSIDLQTSVMKELKRPGSEIL